MNKFTLGIALILTMLLISFLKGYGEEKSIKAEYISQTGESTFDTTLSDINHRTHGRDTGEFILSY